jgi:hypothetical protein
MSCAGDRLQATGYSQKGEVRWPQATGYGPQSDGDLFWRLRPIRSPHLRYVRAHVPALAVACSLSPVALFV